MLKLVRCVKIGKTGECKNGNYGLYKGRKNQDFMAKYSPLTRVRDPDTLRIISTSFEGNNE